MKRRSVLAGVTASSIAVTGCLGANDLPGDDSNPPRPTEIIEKEFETGVDTDASVGDEPNITVDRTDATVTVEGVGEYGSSSCGYLTARDPSYDPDDSELSVTVAAERDRSDEAICGDDVASSPYRFVIRFDEGVPARIEAEHPFERRATKEP